jgi:hypothetical protein
MFLERKIIHNPSTGSARVMRGFTHGPQRGKVLKMPVFPELSSFPPAL